MVWMNDWEFAVLSVAVALIIILGHYAVNMASVSTPAAATALEVLVIPAPAATSDTDATVIWLHGLGDDSVSWKSFAEHVQRTLPFVRFVIPSAPIIDVTVAASRTRAWHDVVDMTSADANTFAHRDRHAQLIAHVVAEEAERLRPRTQTQSNMRSRIILGGFSQGAAMAVMTALRLLPFQLAGIIALSGYWPATVSVSDALAENAITWSGAPSATASIFVAHGARDTTVPVRAYSHLIQALRHGRIDVQAKLYDALGHSLGADELDDVTAFIQKTLGNAT